MPRTIIIHGTNNSYLLKEKRKNVGTSPKYSYITYNYLGDGTNLSLCHRGLQKNNKESKQVLRAGLPKISYTNI